MAEKLLGQHAVSFILNLSKKSRFILSKIDGLAAARLCFVWIVINFLRTSVYGCPDSNSMFETSNRSCFVPSSNLIENHEFVYTCVSMLISSWCLSHLKEILMMFEFYFKCWSLFVMSVCSRESLVMLSQFYYVIIDHAVAARIWF